MVAVDTVDTAVSEFLPLTHSLLEEGGGLLRSRKLRSLPVHKPPPPRSSEQWGRLRKRVVQWGCLHVVPVDPGLSCWSELGDTAA